MYCAGMSWKGEAKLTSAARVELSVSGTISKGGRWVTVGRWSFDAAWAWKAFTSALAASLAWLLHCVLDQLSYSKYMTFAEIFTWSRRVAVDVLALLGCWFTAVDFLLSQPPFERFPNPSRIRVVCRGNEGPRERELPAQCDRWMAAHFGGSTCLELVAAWLWWLVPLREARYSFF